MPFAEVNGIRLRYETWGTGKTPVLLIHGLGSCAEDWFMQLGALGRDFHCITVDLRGHGLSDKPDGEYSVPLFAADVALLLAAVGATPAHIVGLSLGGMVAQQLGIAHPHTARSLTLLSTLPGVWPLTREMMWAGLHRFRPGATPSMDDVARRVAGSLFPRKEDAWLREMCQRRLEANDPAAYRRAMLAVVRYRPGDRLGKIGCPVLILTGGSDHVVPAEYQDRLRAGIPHAKFLVIAGGGHACNIDYSDEVNAALLEFLRRQA